jgi:hypothetical protein
MDAIALFDRDCLVKSPLSMERSLSRKNEGRSMGEREADAARRAADLAGITAACEKAYADASRDGYVDNPTVVAAVATLRTAHAALVAADTEYSAAAAKGGLLRLTRAAWRTGRASRSAEAAYVALRATVLQAGEENLRKMGFGSESISNLRAAALMSRTQ